MKTAAQNRKIRDLIQGLTKNILIPRPEFQRRLVWSNDDKNSFIDTILRGYPFPELYIADGDVNLETGESTEILVDGQQRLNSIYEYFSGSGSLKLKTSIPPYHALSDEHKKDFLLYDVAVRHLGNASADEIINVFQRINATKYALNDMEINNAVFHGALKQFAQTYAEHEFFETHNIFRASQLKRMGDVRFVLSIIITLMMDYFNRDELLEEYLYRYNDEFDRAGEIGTRLARTLEFYERCQFSDKSRAFKQADCFTLIVEIDRALHILEQKLDPTETRARVETFFSLVDENVTAQTSEHAAAYRKAVIQAANDRVNRRTRGIIIASVLLGKIRMSPRVDIFK